MPNDATALAVTQTGSERSASSQDGVCLENEVVMPQLSDLSAAACLKTNCDADALRDATRSAGYVLFEADLKGVKGKKNLLNALAQAAEYPDEFGANWDALVDMLCDFSWHPARGYVLLLRNVSPTLGLSANDREIAQDILDDTVVYWRQRNKPFWIFLV